MSMDKKKLTNELITIILTASGKEGIITAAKSSETLYNSLKPTARDMFEKDLTNSLNSIAENERIDETIFVSVKEAFENVFKRYNLLQLPSDKNKILSELNKYHGEENDSFNRLCDLILTACNNNLDKLCEDGELIKGIFLTINDIANQIDVISKTAGEIQKDLGATTSNVRNTREGLNGEHTPPKTTPQSDNEIYEVRYEFPLFLESDMEVKDGKTVSLSDVFVEPNVSTSEVKQKFDSIDNMLKAWAQNPDYKNTINRRTVFLLYGKAGVGKSSYTSKIITDEAFPKECLALGLRRYTDKISMDKPWESIKNCFNCDDDSAYNDTVIILDGLDEVCVLNPNFKGDIFVENLINNFRLAANKIKILITSRDGYFEEVKSDTNLLIATISWNESQIEEWCNKYTAVHENRRTWAEKYIKDYKKLPENDEKDKRREVFCIPIILYICCVREIAIADNSSLVGVYEKAFNDIGMREHDKRDSGMKEDDKRTFKVNWQYTKELAYRIFLDGESPTVLGNEGVKSAKEHTKKKFNSDCKPMFDRYFALFPFASEKKNTDNPEGMEFAHKTVTDYFTAVKLYEDYLENCNSPDELWQMVWKAFRYKLMPSDIMGYLIDIIKGRQGDNFENWCNSLFRNYYEGLKKQSVWLCLDKPEYECKDIYNYQIPRQVGLVFLNLTNLLTRLGYKNDEVKPDKPIDREYANGLSSLFPRSVSMNVFCENWKGFRGVDLRFAYLNFANLSGADLRDADLSSADLNFANLIGADLSGADLRKADLIGADLSFADLSDADLRNADLSDADLSYADLSDADLSDADLSDADLSDADLRGATIDNTIWSSGQKIYAVKLYDTDLPKYDEAIENYKIELDTPRIYSEITGELLEYNPETNRTF